MVSDATTFFWAFTAVFGIIAYYLWHIERRARALEERLRALEVSRPPEPPDRDP